MLDYGSYHQVCVHMWGLLTLSLSLSLSLLFSSLSLGNCLNNYKPNKINKPQFLPTAVFSHTEDYGKLIT